MYAHILYKYLQCMILPPGRLGYSREPQMVAEMHTQVNYI